MRRRMRTDYRGDDFPPGWFSAWFCLVALLAIVWFATLVWLIISIIGWIRGQ